VLLVVLEIVGVVGVGCVVEILPFPLTTIFLGVIIKKSYFFSLVLKYGILISGVVSFPLFLGIRATSKVFSAKYFPFSTFSSVDFKLSKILKSLNWVVITFSNESKLASPNILTFNTIDWPKLILSLFQE